MTVCVDSSALHAIVDADDENHAAGAAEWRHLLEGGTRLRSHSYVVVETSALV